MKTEFWSKLETLLAESQIVIDRPKGQPHPRYPDLIYPLDYGYLADTTGGDGDGIDVWVGSLADKTLTGILCTFDSIKRDAEIKLLTGCSTQDVEAVLHFNADFMDYLYVPNPDKPEEKIFTTRHEGTQRFTKKSKKIKIWFPSCYFVYLVVLW